MHRGVAKLERALVGAVEARDDPHVFCLGVVHVERHIGDGKAAVQLDVLHDRAQRVRVRRERERLTLAAERNVYAALDKAARRKAHRAQRVAQVLLDVLGAAGGAVDAEHSVELFADVGYVDIFHGGFLPDRFFTILPCFCKKTMSARLKFADGRKKKDTQGRLLIRTS